MAGGDHDAADGALFFDRQGNCGSGRGLVREANEKAIPRENLRDAAGELIRKEAAVIADYRPEFGARLRVLFPERGCGLGDAVEVGKSEILADHSAPAIRTELNRASFHQRLVTSTPNKRPTRKAVPIVWYR